jgi:hypothetical protein
VVTPPGDIIEPETVPLCNTSQKWLNRIDSMYVCIKK